MFLCEICGSTFSLNKSLLRHKRTVHGNQKRQCANCDVNLNGVDSYTRHLKQQKKCDQCGITLCGKMVISKHQREHDRADKEQAEEVKKRKIEDGRMAKCNYCFKEKPLLLNKGYCEDCDCGHDCKKCHKPKAPHLYSEDPSVCKACANRKGGSAFRGAVTTTYIPFTTNTDLLQAFKETEDEIVDRINVKTEQDRGVKYYLSVNIGFNKPIQDISTETGFTTNMNIALQGSEVDLTSLFNEIYLKMEEFCREGSGWVFTDVIDIILHMATYQPLLL